MERKQYLPRHTNLASQSSRFGAFFVDLALTFILFLGFFYGCFVQIFWFNGGFNLSHQMQTYFLDSTLCNLKIHEDGHQSVEIIDSKDDYKPYESAISYYYLNYLTDTNLIEGKPAAPNAHKEISLDDGTKVEPSKYYTVAWFNLNVLGINENDPDRETSSLYFTYQRNELGEYDKTKIGTPKTKRFNPEQGQIVELTKEDIIIKYQTIYQVAYRHLENQDFYLEVANKYYMGNAISCAISLIIAGLISYVILPLIFKNGQTLGKKILKLGLANFDGYKFKNRQLAMRFMPYAVVSIALPLPFWNSSLTLFLIVLIVVLVSFALMMASPKRASLHDFCARTIVIDKKTSIIFEDFAEEALYLEKEDNLPPETNSGEEPEICYEKYDKK